MEEAQRLVCSGEAEAIRYACRGVNVSIIAEMTDRNERTVRDWLSAWRAAGLNSVVTGHAGNQSAAKLTRCQKGQLKEALSKPSSQSGVQVDFWGVPALRNVVKILFYVEYQSDSSYRLLLKLCGMSFKQPEGERKRTRFYVDRKRVHHSLFGALRLTEKNMRIYPIEGNQNAGQTTLVLTCLACETPNNKIAVVPDNTRFHHDKAVTELHRPGQP